MNFCEICGYSSAIKCNMTRHKNNRHKDCLDVIANNPKKKNKSAKKSANSYAILVNLIIELKGDIIKLKDQINKAVSLQTSPAVLPPLKQEVIAIETPKQDIAIETPKQEPVVYKSIKVKDIKEQLRKNNLLSQQLVPPSEITCEYLTDTFASAPNIETVITQIGCYNRGLFEPIDRIEDEEDMMYTLNLSYKGTQLIFDNGDPFSWDTAYFIDDVEDYLKKCKEGKEEFYLKLFKRAAMINKYKCFYYDKKEDLYWVKSKNTWNTFWISEARAIRYDIVEAINKYGFNIIRYSKCGLIEASNEDISDLMVELRNDVDCKKFETALLDFFKNS